MTKRSYFYAIGKRKTSRATVRLYPEGGGNVLVNDVALRKWAEIDRWFVSVNEPMDLLGEKKNIDLEIIVSGGGKNAQAEAIQLGISRALVKYKSDFRSQLKERGMLTRDSRVKERKKPGLKRARRAPQWAKR